nr:DUF3293 domain-containing protein [Salsipaludibacter albus]
MVRALGFGSKSQFRTWSKTLGALRDCLGHGSTVLTAIPDVGEALAFLDDLRLRTHVLWGRLRYGHDLVDAQVSSVIEVEVDGTWTQVVPTQDRVASIGSQDSGLDRWSGPEPRYKITASNPGGVVLDADRNARRRGELADELHRRGLEVQPARAGSGDHWEAGYLVTGGDRPTMCDVGATFGQLSIFEVGDSELRVVDSATREVVARRPLDG